MTVRYDAINKMLVRHMEDVNANKGRAAYSGKGADETDKFLGQMAALRQKYTVPKFWIMLEKEFKDDKVSLILNTFCALFFLKIARRNSEGFDFHSMISVFTNQNLICFIRVFPCLRTHENSFKEEISNFKWFKWKFCCKNIFLEVK